ncbi:DNA/RNA helicase domain-containing protein [Sphingobacterium hungaricum]
MSKKFFIQQSEFSDVNLVDLPIHYYNYLSWPLVYFLSEEKNREAYVGETTDLITRMKTHIKSERKNKLVSLHLIFSDLFNKSATLDIESNLIKYLSADGYYKLQNGNLGIANHQFYQKKEVYWDLFRDIWSELRGLGIAKHSLEHIDNSDLFKYSPYKSLSPEQIDGLKTILKCLLDENAFVSLIEGGAGTGKSILAIFLFKLLKTDLSDFNYSDFDETDEELFQLQKNVREKYGQVEMALVIPMSSFRKTISNVFKNIKGLNAKMVIGPSEVVKKKYDLLIVDESHRLRRRVNLGSYYGTFDKNSELLHLDKDHSSELDWIMIQSKKSILFYDQKQSIKPSDVSAHDFEKLRLKTTTRYERLTTQFRVIGGMRYVNFINNLLDNSTKDLKPYSDHSYESFLYESLDDMVDAINAREKQFGLSRMIAGFAWEWISKEDKSKYDIVIGETKLHWNSVTVDWVNTANAIHEVGCIHTIQGYDLNYAGVIIGPEISYDPVNKTIIVRKELYKDKAGKNSIKDDEILKNYIINVYKTILLRGIKGTFIYVCDKNLRDHFQNFWNIKTIKENTESYSIQNYKSSEHSIPYYDLNIAAGSFSDFQTVENVSYIELPNLLKSTGDYFACRVVGESMNTIIPNGSVALFRKYYGGSRNGLICLVESSSISDYDLGGQYTIKEYQSKKTYSEEGWQHEEIALIPHSSDKIYKPIVLRDEELLDFKVIGEFVRVL